MWQCANCGQASEEQFDACWKCGARRGVAEGNQKASTVNPAGPDPIVCPRCETKLDFVGTKSFREGDPSWTALLGNIAGELFSQRQNYDVYVCPRCGRIELFVDGIGEQFRQH